MGVTSSESSDVIVNLSEIVGKPLSEVEKLLGKANKIEKAKPSGTPCKENPCDKAFFDSEKIEILFINGKADWITINDVSKYPLDENNIKLLGYPKSSPSFSNPSTVIRWSNVDGIKEIDFFNNGSGKIEYIYVKVKTE